MDELQKSILKSPRRMRFVKQEMSRFSMRSYNVSMSSGDELGGR